MKLLNLESLISLQYSVIHNNSVCIVDQLLDSNPARANYCQPADRSHKIKAVIDVTATDKQMKPIKTDQTWQLNKRLGRHTEDVCGLPGTRLHPLITVASWYTGCFTLGLISGRRCLPRGEDNEKWLSWETLYVNSVLLTFKTLTSCLSCSSQKQWSWQFDA